MNEKAKLGLAFVAAAAVVSGVWITAGLPYSPTPFLAWYAGGVVALTLLFATLELSKRNLQRLAGVTLLLSGLVAALGSSNPNAFGRSNLLDVLNRHGELGVICVGAALLIITGGIDLSIGSLVGLSAVAFGVLMENGIPPLVALVLVLLLGVVVGIFHGLLVTQLRLQAFLVTLCGMFIYRGLARTICKGQTGMVSLMNQHEASWPGFADQLLGLRFWLTGINPEERLVFPGQLIVMLLLASVAAVFLHRSAFGRYWYAIGYNEQAARYAGVNVWRHRVSVFAICSTLSALAGVLLFLSAGSVSPSSVGVEYELYAITAVVLGGVSLRGGEGTAVGVVLGAMVLPVVRTLMNFTKCPDEWIPWMIGLILLFGTIADEMIRRRSNKS